MAICFYLDCVSQPLNTLGLLYYTNIGYTEKKGKGHVGSMKMYGPVGRNVCTARKGVRVCATVTVLSKERAPNLGG